MKTPLLILLFLGLGLAACDGSAPIAAAIDAPVTGCIGNATVSPASATLRVGDTLRARASLSSCSVAGRPTVQWTTSNAAVARVDSTGLVLARAQGLATIVASLSAEPAVKSAMAVNVVP